MTKEKSWKLQLSLNQPVSYMTSMFEKELRAYHSSLNLSCLHIVFVFSPCTNSCPNEECYGGQTKTNQTLPLLRM